MSAKVSLINKIIQQANQDLSLLPVYSRTWFELLEKIMKLCNAHAPALEPSDVYCSHLDWQLHCGSLFLVAVLGAPQMGTTPSLLEKPIYLGAGDKIKISGSHFKYEAGGRFWVPGVVVFPYCCQPYFSNTDWCQATTPCVHNIHLFPLDNFQKIFANIYPTAILDSTVVREAVYNLNFASRAKQSRYFRPGLQPAEPLNIDACNRVLNKAAVDYLLGDDTHSAVFTFTHHSRLFELARAHHIDGATCIRRVTGKKLREKSNCAVAAAIAIEAEDYFAMLSMLAGGEISQPAFAELSLALLDVNVKVVGSAGFRKLKGLLGETWPKQPAQTSAITFLRTPLRFIKRKMGQRRLIADMRKQNTWFSVIPMDIVQLVLDYLWFSQIRWRKGALGGDPSNRIPGAK